MTQFKTRLRNVALTAALTAGALGLTATAASADIACNRYGECWHVSSRYTTYPVQLGVMFHDDAWRAHHRRHYHWRSDRPDDHGYYSRGRWHTF